jgi:hypothetical protein
MEVSYELQATCHFWCRRAVSAATTAKARPAFPIHAEPEVARCIRQASQGKGWLEKTLWGLRDQEGGWVGAEVANSNGTHDLGVLQVNSGWVPQVARLIGRPVGQVRDWLRYDPCFNAEAARWIFLSALGQSHDYWKAIGVYHSPTAWRQRRYALRVADHLRKRFGAGLFTLASADRAEEGNGGP